MAPHLSEEPRVSSVNGHVLNTAEINTTASGTWREPFQKDIHGRGASNPSGPAALCRGEHTACILVGRISPARILNLNSGDRPETPTPVPRWSPTGDPARECMPRTAGAV